MRFSAYSSDRCRLSGNVLVAGKGTDDLPPVEGRASATVKAYVCEAYPCQEPTDDREPASDKPTALRRWRGSRIR